MANQATSMFTAVVTFFLSLLASQQARAGRLSGKMVTLLSPSGSPMQPGHNATANETMPVGSPVQPNQNTTVKEMPAWVCFMTEQPPRNRGRTTATPHSLDLDENAAKRDCAANKPDRDDYPYSNWAVRQGTLQFESPMSLIVAVVSPLTGIRCAFDISSKFSKKQVAQIRAYLDTPETKTDFSSGFGFVLGWDSC